MNKTEAQSRIKINRLLEDANWRFFDDEGGSANIQLEQGTKITRQSIDAFGENFEKTSDGRRYLISNFFIFCNSIQLNETPLSQINLSQFNLKLS